MKSRLRTRMLTLAMALVATLAVTSVAHAAPANPEPQQFTQPDGTSIVVHMKGDERFHWFETPQGVGVTRDSSKTWRYVSKSGPKTLVPGLAVGKDATPLNAARSADMNRFARTEIMRSMSADPELTPQLGSQLDTGEPLMSARAPISSRPMLALLIEFNDRSFNSAAYPAGDAEAYWQQRLFLDSSNDSQRTLRDYFDEVSGRRFAFTPAAETSGTYNDGVIRVRVNSNHPNDPGTSTGTQTAIVSALTAANPSINFATYDKNGDGTITNDELVIYAIVAGYESSTGVGKSPSVWGHSWSVSGGVNLDGKKLVYSNDSRYGVSGELYNDSVPMTIGIIAHELGHTLGLPDLYDTTNASFGVGPLSLMGSGNWGAVTTAGDSPTHMDAWSKWMLGFGGVQVGTSSTNFNLSSSSSSDYSMAAFPAGGSTYTTSKPSSGEWFFVENRQFSGFDQGLKRYFTSSSVKGGLLVLHVDWSIINQQQQPNSNYLHKGVDVEESNEGLLGKSQLDTKQSPGSSWDHFYYPDGGHASVFGPWSTPDSDLYTGAASNFTITATSASSSVMSLSFNNGITTQYTVSFNSNGGTNVASQKVSAGATVVQPANPTRSGYTFAGWYSDAGLTTPWSFSTGVTKDMTLYAKWTVQTGLSVVSLEGSSRYETAVAISKRSYPGGLPSQGPRTVVLSTGANWPDALSGSALAGAFGEAPLLLTEPTTLTAATRSEITRLGAAKVIILGGTGAVSDSVHQELLWMGLEVERVSGDSRYETADKIAERLVRQIEAIPSTIILTTGMNYPDAVAGSPLAFAEKIPVYLVDPVTGLSNGARDMLRSGGVSKVLILGGPGVVSEQTRSVVQSLAPGAQIERLYGDDAYATAAQISHYAVDNYGFSWANMGMATRESFPDALAGGALQGKQRSVLLLTPSGYMYPAVANTLWGVRGAPTSVTFFGGVGAICQTVRDQTVSLLSINP